MTSRRPLVNVAGTIAELPSGDSFAASLIANTPAGNIAATDVQSAINELDSEKAATGHNHDGVYEPADATILKDSDIGSSVQAYDVDLDTWATKSAPTGYVVGTTDTQTLTNKTLEGYSVKATSNAASLGSELVTNGGFTGNATGWTLGTNWAYGTNNVVLTLNASAEGTLSQTISNVVSGAVYQISWSQKHSVASNGLLYVKLGSAAVTSQGVGYGGTVNYAVTGVVTATASGSLELTFTTIDILSSGTITVGNISVKLISLATPCKTELDSANAVTNESRRSLAAYLNYFEGANAGQANITGSANFGIGSKALQALTTGSNNVAVGFGALYGCSSGTYNVGIGTNACLNALYNSNIGIGYFALGNCTGGQGNTAIGHQAGVTDISANSLKSSDFCTFIGFNSGFATSTNYNAATAIGYLAKVSSANTVVLGRTTDVTVLGATADDGSGNRLQVTGGIKATTIVKTGSYTVATLPSASTSGAGARAFVTDANSTTFLATAVGGGANAVPVVSNGTSWVIG